MNLDQYSLEELQDFMQTEDFEQLDELSKETLQSYIAKAKPALAKIRRAHTMAFKYGTPDTPAKHGRPAKRGKYNQTGSLDLLRQDFMKKKGIERATRRLSSESNESLGLLVKAINEGNSLDISRLFDKIMSEKIEDLIEYRKEQIAEELFNESSHPSDKFLKPISQEEHHKIIDDNNLPKNNEKWKAGIAKKFVNGHGEEFVTIHHPDVGTHLFYKSPDKNKHTRVSFAPENDSDHFRVLKAYTKEMSKKYRFN